jgi:adhesin transport system outer membrane protein
MLSKYALALPAVVMAMILSGCESSGPAEMDKLDETVLEMTRSDVTERPDGTTARPSISHSTLGYKDALRASVLESPEFHAAVQRFREAESGIRLSQSATRPQISGSMSTSAFRFGADGTVGSGTAANVTLSQLLYDGGKTRANIAGATARAYAARVGIDVAGNDVAMQAAVAWRDLWEVTTLLGILNEDIAEVEKILGRIQTLISSGLVDRAAFASGQRQLLDLKLEQERLNTARRDAQERFDRYFGSKPSKLPAPDRLFTNAELERFVADWQNSPTLIGAAAEIIAAERDVEAARAEFRPNFDLQMGVRTPNEDGNTSPDASVGVGLTYVFGDGGRRASQLAQREQALAAQRESFEAQKDELEVSAETKLAQHKSLRASVSVLQEQIRQLDTERDTLRSQITSGQADLRQLVETEGVFYRTRARLLEVRGEIATLELTIAAATGHLPKKLGIDTLALLNPEQ